MSNPNFSRRGAILAVAAMSFTTSTLAFAATGSDEKPNLLSITKDPGCGCCGALSGPIRPSRRGSRSRRPSRSDYVGMKRDAAVPENLWSCHTTRIGGYIVEGHVPFRGHQGSFWNSAPILPESPCRGRPPDRWERAAGSRPPPRSSPGAALPAMGAPFRWTGSR